MRPRRARLRYALLLFALAAIASVGTANARPGSPVLHEPIPPDPREDLAMHVALEGDLPAALETWSGVVGAPDLRAPPLASETSYGPGAAGDSFAPDRETKRPDVGAYDDPFTPATAPFKRLEAFDGVRSDYRLYVHDPRLVEVPVGGFPGTGDDAFYADLVVEIGAGESVRIPSVGPGARIIHAHLAEGTEDMPMRIRRDGAENWFLEGYRPRGPGRARLVMQVVAPRQGFGGELADAEWSDLPRVPLLPDNVARESAVVRSAVGVSRRMRPRAAIAKLVAYFRDFVDSDDPPHGRGSIYLDLALSKKGVCRHRAFAFLVTALGLGIPTRMVINEAHAWVEVHDGVLWRRIDLGGAGRMTAAASEAAPEQRPYDPPADALPWPAGAQRGAEMAKDGRAQFPSPTPATETGAPAGNATPIDSATASSEVPSPGKAAAHEDPRTFTAVSIAVADGEAHTGRPLVVRGSVRSEGEPCPRVAVELWMRVAGTQTRFQLGTLVTGDDGAFAGGIVVPVDAPLGDYDVIARTSGDAQCGPGTSE